MKKIVTMVFLSITFFLSSVAWAGGISSIVSQQVANQISRSTSHAISKNLADRLIIPTLKINNESGEVKDISVSHDSRLLCLLHDDDSVRVWDLYKGVQRPVIKSQGEDFQFVLAVSKGNLIVVGGENGEVTVYDALTGQLKQKILSGHGDVLALSSSSDESKLIVAYENGVVIIWDLLQFIKLAEIQTPHDDAIKFVLFEPKAQNFVVAGEGGFVDRWNIKKAASVGSFTKDIDDVIGIWINQATGQIFFIDKEGTLQQFGLLNNVLGADFVEDILSAVIDQNSAVLALSTDDKKIKLFNINDLKLRSVIKLNEELYHLEFINQGKHLIASDDKGILHVIDVTTAKEILKLISTETGWTIVDNKGRFDSSEKGMENVFWEADDDDIYLNSFSSTHYEPGLLASHLGDQQFINKTPVIIPKGIKLPPEVIMNIPDGSREALVPFVINVEAQGLGGGVDKIKLYHNGKTVPPSSPFNEQKKTANKLIKKTVAFRLSPSVGRNTFKVVAINNMGIEGSSEEVSIDFEGEKQKSTLHILTIGINKYKDAELNLDYSVADAVAISNIFKTSGTVVYDEVEYHSLYDKDATKKNILQQLNKISEYAQNDVLVLYVAGHGLAVNGDWYFLPHETIRKDNVNYYTKIGVSANDFQQMLLNSKIQRVIIMVDACYSGAGLKEFRKLQDTQRHFSRQLSKSVGVVVLAATRNDQEAVELSDLGHGLFTYVVSDGLMGKADLKPKNFKVSAHEIADFSTETIPIFSKKYMGASQEPTSFTMGRDFILLQNK